MDFRLEEALRLLSRTPVVLEAMLTDLPEAWLHTSEEEWTAFGVVGHLIHGEKTDWVPRIHIILEHGESKPFAPFDRTAHLAAVGDRNFAQLLDEFRTLRQENLRQIQLLSLSETDLTKRGMHPALGSVALGEYIAAWAVHDLTHLHQLTRILAKHYQAACGPLRDYMGVFRATGPA